MLFGPDSKTNNRIDCTYRKPQASFKSSRYIMAKQNII
jgi:hypothetical protein